MDPDGRHLVNLTAKSKTDDMAPNWRADGRRIAFLSDRDGDLEVYTMRPDGSSVRQLTSNDGFEFQPNWSPDGGQITFTSDRTDSAEVFVMDADGTNQTNLTANHKGGDFFSAWSPDGRKIVHLSGNYDIFTMNADGSDQLRLTKGPAFDFESDWQPLPDRD
jgi:Tol biopolymer transport system component